MSPRVPRGSNTVLLKVNTPVNSRTPGISRDPPPMAVLLSFASHPTRSGDGKGCPEQGLCHCQARASAASLVNKDLSTRQASPPVPTPTPHTVSVSAQPFTLYKVCSHPTYCTVSGKTRERHVGHCGSGWTKTAKQSSRNSSSFHKV